jgi:hypothetical protein
MWKLGGAALRADGGLLRLEEVVRAAQIAPGLAVAVFWIRHRILL